MPDRDAEEHQQDRQPEHHGRQPFVQFQPIDKDENADDEDKREEPPRAGALNKIDNRLEEGAGEEDLKNRLVELAEKLLPNWLARERRQPVRAKSAQADVDFFMGQPAVARGRELLEDLAEGAHPTPRNDQ